MNFWLVLQHVSWEGPGLIAVEAAARGLRTEVRLMDSGASIPGPDEIEGLIVMGGPMGAYETDRYSFLDAECHLIAEMIRRNRPVLGVCLGAQLLAKALGARVFAGHQPEIGFGRIQLTEEGMQDAVLGPGGPSLPVFHWHGDTFELPAGATLLASSDEYPHQAFRFGRCAYGLQFHVEPDSNTWQAWRHHLSAELIEEAGQRSDALEKVGTGLISRFFGLAISKGGQTR